jgi:hypothetical protein
VIGAAVMVGRIATGEIEDRPATPESEGKNPAAEPYGPRGDDTPPRRGTVPNPVAHRRSRVSDKLASFAH